MIGMHFREGDMLEMVTNFSSRINKRCVAMPNTEIPITDTNKASSYKELLERASNNNFIPLIPCYLNENLDLEDFRTGIQNKVSSDLNFILQMQLQTQVME